MPYDTTTDTQLNGGGVPNALNSIAISPDGQQLWVAGKKDNVRRGLSLNGEDLDHDNILRAFAGVYRF